MSIVDVDCMNNNNMYKYEFNRIRDLYKKNTGLYHNSENEWVQWWFYGEFSNNKHNSMTKYLKWNSKFWNEKIVIIY